MAMYRLVYRVLSLLLAMLMMVSVGLCCVGCGNAPDIGKTDDTDVVSDTDAAGDTGDTGDTGDVGDIGDTEDVTDNRSDYGTTVLAPTGITRGSFDRSKFHIGTYCFSGDETVVQALNECGIDFIASHSPSREELDTLWKYGIGVFASNIVAGWWGDGGANAGQYGDAHPMSMYDDAAASFADHPAIFAIDIGDEPNLLDYPYIGQVVSKISELFPSQFSYVNLYPFIASRAQLGGSYKQYYEDYIQYVPTDYLCYDYYPYAGTGNDWYSNLKMTADLCTENDRSLWVVMECFYGPISGESYGECSYITANQLRLQAYTAMAYGAELITWACWSKGWGSSFPYEEGQLTAAYDNLKTVNHEILGFADTFMKYRRLETWMLGFTPGTWTGRVLLGTELTSYDVLPAVGVFENLTMTETGRNLVIGEMAPRNGDGSSALMIAEATEFGKEHTKTTELTFSVVDSRTVKVYSGDTVVELEPDADGVYHLHIEPYAGILLVAERK